MHCSSIRALKGFSGWTAILSTGFSACSRRKDSAKCKGACDTDRNEDAGLQAPEKLIRLPYWLGLLEAS